MIPYFGSGPIPVASSQRVYLSGIIGLGLSGLMDCQVSSNDKRKLRVMTLRHIPVVIRPTGDWSP